MKSKIYNFDCLVIGSGAAGYNAINRLTEDKSKKSALITEGVMMGTSRNTGSDKQTYYKLGLSGDSPDSVIAMAKNLFAPGSVDGDNALVEAALSPRCFLNLCELGVAFPHNRYGEYIGYKTDHDPFERATSAGPLTSKFMTEALEKKAKKLGVKIFDNLYAVKVLKQNNEVIGLITLDKKTGEFVLFNSPNIIMATGGPAGIYQNSVYPTCHTGSTSLAVQAGAKLQNVSEWQYGLASIAPRWNVSGTYMQVLPRFVSIDNKGKEYEFLADYFSDKYDALNNIFLKGYQWPFDSNKVLKGSSVIDLLVYREITFKHRRVYLDYTKNPFNLKTIDLNKLNDEVKTYLVKAGAKQKTPIERLKHMNQPAIDLYKSKGLDITKKYLEIALCAQHHNGGVAVNKWWETSVTGLFACGECAGTHGVSRPGGSALNAGQVGSLRATQFVINSKRQGISNSAFIKIANKELNNEIKFVSKVLKNKDNVHALIDEAGKRMSDYGAAIRELANMNKAFTLTKKDYEHLNQVGVKNKTDLVSAYKYKDILITQMAVLTSLLDFAKTIKKTRGSALYYQKNGKLREGLDEIFRFIPDDGKSKGKVQEVSLVKNNFKVIWRDVRPIPQEDNFFENVWRRYREDKNIF
ncbi:MAG: FAD-binding protein [Bacilli bacterium]|nr:FAD-binding protein [Bacilli bacterium]